MNERNQRGREIAKSGGVEHIVGDYWLVKSQTNGRKTYQVNSAESSCTCPDFTGNGSIKCKHLYAVEIWGIRNFSSVELEGPDEPFKAKRLTCPQDWASYNKAQTNEALDFPKILYRLVATIQQPEYELGRPEFSLMSKTFCCVYRTYLCRSARRVQGELQREQAVGRLPHVPHFNTLQNWMNDPRFTDILHRLIATSGRALIHVETDFAIDSTGFSTSRFARWHNFKHGREMTFREWVKVHAICGVKTNIITAADISGWSGPDSHDTNYFIPLLDRTADQYGVENISADKAYLSGKNAEFSESVGATLYSPIKSNTLPVFSADTPWERLVIRTQDDSVFRTFYGKRNNAESTFSAVERLFQKIIRSTNWVGQVNESLCKLLCYNIVVLIHQKYKRGIEPEFGEPTIEHISDQREMRCLLALLATANWPLIVKEFRS